MGPSGPACLSGADAHVDWGIEAELTYPRRHSMYKDTQASVEAALGPAPCGRSWRAA